MNNNENSLELTGKKVLLFPRDTYRKVAVIEKVDQYGFYFKITLSSDDDFEVNKTYFYNHAARLSFKFL